MIGGDTEGAGPKGEGLITRRRGVRRRRRGGESNNSEGADGSIFFAVSIRAYEDSELKTT